MKRKLMAIAAGTLLSLMTLKVAPVQAQADLFPALSGLELTEQQHSQLNTLRQQTRSDIEAILTAEQEESLRTAWTERDGLRKAIANLNLTAQQRDQLRQVFQSARTEFSSILTPEQQQQLRQNLRDLVQQR